MVKQLFYFFKVIKQLGNTKKATGKVFLFATLRSYIFPLHQEMFMANILARNGAKVYILLDDGKLDHWDTCQIHANVKILNPSNSFFHKLKKYFLLLIYSHKNISILYTSDILKTNQWNNIRLEDEDLMNVISSVRRYFECGFYNKEDKLHHEYYNLSINNCKKIKYVSNIIFEQIKFNAIITSHGIYSLWGSLYNFFKKKNVPIYVYGGHSYKIDELQFTDTLAQTLADDSFCDNFMKSKQVLNDSELKQIKDYFDLRISHKTKDTHFYYSWIDNFNDFLVEKNDQSIKTFCIFPNVIWDGDIVQRDTIFDGVLDWLIKTVNHFKESKHNLVIRFHPAEATLWKDSVKLKDVLTKLMPDLYNYKNIYIIDSWNKIDTYTFIKNNVDVGIVYDGVLSLELTYLQKPVITPSKNRFNRGKYVFSPDTLTEYYSLLDNPPNSNTIFTKENLDDFFKYSYWYFFDSAYIMPIYSESKFGKIVYNKNTLHKLQRTGFIKFKDRLLRL
jgi:hypothetical protein